MTSRKKIDKRIPTAIENGFALGHRTLFVITGEKAKDQVVVLHHLLSKSSVRARPTVLWCYKKELGFTSHRKKRMKQLQKKIKCGTLEVDESDHFELFVAATNIRYCYYSETHKILGNTYGMCVLQDFEALTPNLLARSVETVEGGGIICVLLRSVRSKKEFCAMAMDVHARYRTEAHGEVVGRFNERFLLSLTSCKKCLLMDDQLNVLPFSTHSLSVEPVKRRNQGNSTRDVELKELKDSLQDTQPIGVLVNCCKTLDQTKALLKFVDAISEKTLRSTVTLTAARGRGKSAALGLAISAAVAFSYSNIFVTSPSPENLTTLFDFILKGFDALDYQEHIDFELIQSVNPEFNKAVVRINVFKDHRQTIQYIHPSDAHKLSQAELVVIDEAAAIPLPLVKNLLGPYLVFMSSTINGYEGTGRSLSLKLIQQLRQQTSTMTSAKKESKSISTSTSATGRILHELQLNESIRYRPGDDVEKWLNELLCLDATLVVPANSTGCPVPQECDLYYINRDTLFSYCKASEVFLQRLMTLYVASHYKNSPNDLQMMSDAPAHHLFCLLGPINPSVVTIPEILCVVQVCLEGEIAKSTIMASLARGKRGSGDLIPWLVSQQFQDNDFPSLSGARIVRISTHPEYQRMGYGTRALDILHQYYQGRIICLDDKMEEIKQNLGTVSDEDGLLTEHLTPRKSLPPLLLKLSERPAERLDYLGVSYGLTAELLRFWKKSGFVPVYLRQTKNDLTGEHSCVMLKNLQEENEQLNWLIEFWKDFRRRFITLLSFEFRSLNTSTALSILKNRNCPKSPMTMSSAELDFNLTPYDLKRLELYSRNMADYHLIMDRLPILGQLYFLQQLGDVNLSAVQSAILLGIGLQRKSVDELVTDLELPSTQILAFFNKIIRKIIEHLNSIKENEVAKTLGNPMNEDEDDDEQQEENQDKTKEEQSVKQTRKTLNLDHLSQYAIKGSDDAWQNALSSGTKGIVSVKGSAVKRTTQDFTDGIDKKKKNKRKKHK